MFEKPVEDENVQGIKSNKSAPLITVVTVVYNGAAHLEQTIQSVIGQGVAELEYIVIDGGSTDGTLDIIKRYGERIDYWCSERDGGIFDAMNKGIKKAHGRLIGLLNADDWYEPGLLKGVKERITNNEMPGALDNVVLYCDHYWLDEELSRGRKIERTAELEYWKGMTISHQSMFIPAAIYQRLGDYNLEYRFAGDYEFFLRMLKAGVTFEKMPVHGVNFRKGGTSSVYMNRSISEVSRIVRKYFGWWSKSYVLFLLCNRLPSMMGNIRILLMKVVGKGMTGKIRRFWHRIKGDI